MPEDPRPTPPHPGEQRLAVITTGVIVAIALVGLLTAVVASFFVEGLGTTIVACAVLLGLAAVGFVITAAERRKFLRTRRYGDPIVRRPPWDSDVGPTHTW